jgi:hypothetical protein
MMMKLFSCYSSHRTPSVSMRITAWSRPGDVGLQGYDDMRGGVNIRGIIEFGGSKA